MNNKTVDLNDYAEDEDLMDIDVDAVREQKRPFVIRRHVIERYYYCRSCAKMHCFNFCPTSPTH